MTSDQDANFVVMGVRTPLGMNRNPFKKKQKNVIQISESLLFIAVLSKSQEGVRPVAKSSFLRHGDCFHFCPVLDITWLDHGPVVGHGVHWGNGSLVCSYCEM